MNIEAIQSLIDDIRAREVELGYDGGCSDADVDRLETLLSVILPAEYRAFLIHFGAMWIDGKAVSGIMDGDPDAAELGSSYCDTERYRDDFDMPRHLVVVQPDEDAPYCIDTAAINGDSSPVVCFQLNTGTYQPITKSFSKFLTDWFLKPLLSTA